MNEPNTNLFPCFGQRRRVGCLPRMRALPACLSSAPFVPLTTTTTTTTTSAMRCLGAELPMSSLSTSFGKQKPTEHGRRKYTGLRLIVKRGVTRGRISLFARRRNIFALSRVSTHKEVAVAGPLFHSIATRAWRIWMSTTISRHRAWLWLSAIVLVCALLAACTSVGGGGTSGNTGVISGVVMAGPTCGAEPAGSPAACGPKPVAGKTVSIIGVSATATVSIAQPPTGPVAATATTDAQGRFSVNVPPGVYVVVVTPASSGFSMRQTNLPQVTVSSGQTVSVTVTLDTGIR